ncbi:MAG: mannose-1-phosphate guanylyltransferase [Lentisphaerae bacterium]|nr:mannose-1-phosphate guanylyltransferase [Lentisphaerota bacterium]
MKKNFYAAILSGGSGERFWPLSTPEHPKQFLSVFGGKSLIRQSVDRLKGVVPAENILIVTAKTLAKATYRELPEIPRKNVLLEPCRRDTAAAVATACTEIGRRGGESAVAAILTADHLMKNEKAFRKILSLAADAAATSDDIVTMGVKPTYPATGFGYIKVGAPFGKVSRAERFVEKPNEATAKRYLKSGRYVWNAGMFVWKVSTMNAALRRFAPQLVGITPKDYENLPKISFDYAVMEKADNVLVTSGDFGWDDVGTWTAADRHLKTDGRRNAIRGEVTLLDCENSVAVAEGANIAALGVKDIVIVTTKDSVLVATKDRVQDLKRLLANIPKPVK